VKKGISAKILVVAEMPATLGVPFFPLAIFRMRGCLCIEVEKKSRRGFIVRAVPHFLAAVWTFSPNASVIALNDKLLKIDRC
jgi:hypothetical protein